MSGQEWEMARASRFRPDGIIGTPFHARTAQSSQTPWYFNWDLNHVVDVYDDFHAELRAIRGTVAMGDMSPLCKAEISGPDAARFVDWVIPRDTSDLKVGSIYYTPWCNHDGKVVSDGLVFRDGEDSYRFTGDPTVEWFRQIADGYDIEVSDVTDDFGILAIQGPRSREVLEAATGDEWSGLDFSRLRPATVGGVPVEVARQGFTGELGYELLTPADRGVPVWDAIAEAGEPFGIRPCGEWAIDVARVEAGLMIPGPDYANAGPDPTGSHTISASDPEFHSSPFELGMGWMVDLAKKDFVGKAALITEQESGGPRRRLVGLDIDWLQIVAAHVDRGVPPNVSPRVEWVAKPVIAEGRPVGRATSITWAPTAGKLIGFGHVEEGIGQAGTRVAITWDIAGTGVAIEAAATVAELPFLDLRRA
jgi:aminomethyltransferase